MPTFYKKYELITFNLILIKFKFNHGYQCGCTLYYNLTTVQKCNKIIIN